MSYLPSYEDEEQPSDPRWRASSPWGGAQAPGDRQRTTKSSAPQWSGGGGWSPAAPPADESQGKFVNFSRYLSGNRGAAGATGEALAGSVGGKAEKAQGDLSSRQTGFGKAVAAGSPFGTRQAAQPSQQVASTPNTMPQAGMPSFTAAPQVAPVAQTNGAPPSAPGVGVSQQGLEGDPSGKAYDPSKDTGAPAPISAAEALARSGQTYTGPGSLGEAPDWQSFLGEGADAANRLSNLGSDEGRQALLEEQYGGRGGYSAGGANLDAGLTGAVSGDRFRQLQAKYGDLNKQISDANVASKAQADAARKQTADIAGKYGQEAKDEQARIDAETQTKNDIQQSVDRDTPGSASWMDRYQAMLDANHKKAFGHEIDDMFAGGYNSKHHLEESWAYLQKLKSTNPKLYDQAIAKIQSDMEAGDF